LATHDTPNVSVRLGLERRKNYVFGILESSARESLPNEASISGRVTSMGME